MENECIKEAKDQFDKLKQDEYEQEQALRRMIHIMDINGAVADSYDKGKEAGILEIAKNMLNSNYSIEEISNITGLSKEEIEKLKE